VLIPFGSVDPHGGAMAVRQARRLVTAKGVRGFKFHPSLQAFEPNDVRFYPLYEAIGELGVPALFHTGQTGIGAGLPGGRGIKLRYSAPMLLDDVAADFPHLTIVLAHPSVPWQDEAISIATHKANVYIDLSGWSPKYFPPELVRAAGGLLKRKVLFGSDFPVITPDRWRADFDALAIKDEVRPLILKDNAVRMLGLGTG
jgi:predicted TIM-barrel fold metal-dependent hydrolase